MALRDSWKNTGVELGHAFRDLGKSLGQTAKVGVRKVSNWAQKDDQDTQHYEQNDQNNSDAKDEKVHDAEVI